MKTRIAIVWIALVSIVVIPPPAASAPPACASESSLAEMTARLVNPSVDPNHENCYDITGTCNVVTNTQATGTRTTVFLVFVVFDRVSVEEEVWTTISCSGTWVFSAIHWGGIGPRWTQSQFGEGEKAPRSSCNYVAPLGWCKTPDLGGPWAFTQEVKGKIALQPSVPTCGKGIHTNTGVDGMPDAVLSGTGQVKEDLCKSTAITAGKSSDGHLTLCIAECQRI